MLLLIVYYLIPSLNASTHLHPAPLNPLLPLLLYDCPMLPLLRYLVIYRRAIKCYRLQRRQKRAQTLKEIATRTSRDDQREREIVIDRDG